MDLSSVILEEFQALALTVVCLVGTVWFNVRLALKATWCQGQAAEGSEKFLNSGTQVRQYLTKKYRIRGQIQVQKWGQFWSQNGVRFWPPLFKS